ncbi:MAG: flagellar assembly protein FliW [Verrucomicrobiota bacterium]|jgi:flagellar assembly factor FliW|nr:flagellar assembly protein FliW [Opitutae bacterium]MEC7395223.1 flagellar assembly protein FliW [Verrucomicrobiota bacterium]MEC8657115.1 flagellar assembly protein FliW [Verrucomicrobiota bacterium]MEC8866533.1 flagellar assembly protein FliW [Verrucomicrobiota bacterium]MED5280932.1 flagellar assembly protein FliW [Verrucomicrobiota bacterium]|tara:strand:- start:905 stop:1360 length:456 start_codon:yes stop_codon:yes gene_type:complete
MKLKIDEDSNNPDIVGSETRNQVDLPQGLFGFSEIRSMELVYDEEELPFMWLRQDDQDGLAFIVIEPGGIIPNYSVEVADADVQILGISGPEDTMILNIVTLPSNQTGKISLNLVGPIIVNRKTLVGKQCIINNHEEYSARHILDVSGESL